MKKIKLYLSCILCLVLSGIQTLRANTIDTPLCTVNVSGQRLKEVITIIENQTNYHFLHSASDKILNQPITLSEKNQPLSVILRKLGAQSGLTFEIDGTTIYVKTSKKQQHITGKVTDAGSGQTIPGASVSVKGKNKRTVTDDSGNYEITAEENDVLQFSFVGYKTYETTASRSVINVALQDDQSDLNEVVVVGYGTQSRKVVSTSVTKVSQDEFNKGGFSNPAQLLQGKVAGLNITRSGDPNATPSISLRGPSTLRTGAAQEPFYVINGVPGADFRLVSPDDIED
ncbi:MAG TPA: carboxypeptidase-like regulatory domain-containing protein, partial [Pedobacter sp.]